MYLASLGWLPVEAAFLRFDAERLNPGFCVLHGESPIKPMMEPDLATPRAVASPAVRLRIATGPDDPAFRPIYYCCSESGDAFRARAASTDALAFTAISVRPSSRAMRRCIFPAAVIASRARSD